MKILIEVTAWIVWKRFSYLEIFAIFTALAYYDNVWLFAATVIGIIVITAAIRMVLRDLWQIDV